MWGLRPPSPREHRAGLRPCVLSLLVLLSTARCDATKRHSPRARAADTASACPAYALMAEIRPFLASLRVQLIP